MKGYLANEGVSHRLTCPYTSEQNGLVERKHRQLAETGLSMLTHVGMPLTHWYEAFSNLIYLINRLPTKPLGNISPYEKLFSVKPDYSTLRVFGCQCFPNLRAYNANKL